ncbi:uncharacterized protein LOC133852120 [Alnus glutinosa]|uniref:uncharacterized protein LOC133852120 n=1 Tax=Alnus glutinosa TaxID=3517 RepID=UPI002D765D69|nr:uncharacterized protein LOC133852120 [Alnus glutinosa]
MVLLNFSSLREPFQILTITLLSLLLPLSFLLLSRFYILHYLLSFNSYPPPQLSSFLFSFFLYINPSVLCLIVSVVCIATLTNGLTTGKLTFLTESPAGRLYTAWIFVCTLQVCVGLGIEGAIAAGVEAPGLNMGEISLLSKVIFFFGLHETTLHWFRVVVKPVVDDTVFGVAREERWAERVALAASFCSLWWWKLREEVEFLVVLPEFKRERLMGVGVADFVGWWLYYLTVTIGMVRVVKAILWLAILLLCRRPVRGKSPPASDGDEDNV